MPPSPSFRSRRHWPTVVPIRRSACGLSASREVEGREVFLEFSILGSGSCAPWGAKAGRRGQRRIMDDAETGQQISGVRAFSEPLYNPRVGSVAEGALLTPLA